MRRLTIIGCCIVAVFAVSASAAVSADAAAPEFGRCIKKATKSGEGYSNAGCTTAVAAKAAYEWSSGPGPEPKFKVVTRKVGTTQRKDCEKGLEETKLAEEDLKKAKEAEEAGKPELAEKYREEAKKHEKREEELLKKAKLTQMQCEELVKSENGYLPAAELETKKTETKSSEVVKCAKLSAEGEYASPEAVGDLTATFSGCELNGVACHSGAAEGTIVTSTLDGKLGVVSIEEKEGKKKIKAVGIALSPAPGGESLSKFECASTAVTVTGSVIREVDTNKMLLEETEEFAQTKGVQEPASFVEGTPDVLYSSFDSEPAIQSGLTTRGTVVNAEEIEVNTIV